MRPHVRHQWVGEPRVLAVADEAPVTLDNFAWESTADLVVVEPRLVSLATLVVEAHPASEESWRAVEQLASLLIGPDRTASQITPVTSRSVAVAGTLHGELTRRRYVTALRHEVEVTS